MKKSSIYNLTRREISDLKKRYLIWLYKITKESLDVIDRKFTQLDIDKAIFKRLEDIEVLEDKTNWNKLLDEFSNYINKKEKDGLALKYSDSQKTLKPDYLFLRNKLLIVEQIILKEFGNKELKRIKSLYEKEMIKRIIQGRERK